MKMRVHKWLANPQSAIIGYAVVEVEPGENSDVEDMLALVDGQIGHFGISVKLIGTDKCPEYQNGKNGLWTHGQFGYDQASTLKTKRRFYEVMVSRD